MIPALRLRAVLGLFLTAGSWSAALLLGLVQVGRDALTNPAPHQDWPDHASTVLASGFMVTMLAALWLAFEEIDRLRLAWRVCTTNVPRRVVPDLRPEPTGAPHPSLWRTAWVTLLFGSVGSVVLATAGGAVVALARGRGVRHVLPRLVALAPWFLALRGIERKRRAWSTFARRPRPPSAAAIPGMA